MKKIVNILLISLFLCTLSYAESATMVHGWSYNEQDTTKAINKAIIELKQNLDEKKARIIFFSSTSIELDVPAMAKEVAKEFPNVPIWGATSALGIFMNNECDYMRGSAVGLLALCSKDYDFFVRGASAGDDPNSYQNSAIQIINEAKEHYNAVPSMVLFTANPGSHEEVVIEELKKGFGRYIPIFGGSCGTEAPNPRYAIANGQSYEKGLSLCFIYTSKKIGYCYQMGYKRESVTGIATDVNGRWVNKIDNRPALEVYNEWTDGFFASVINDGKSIRGEGQMYHPLAMVKKSDNTELTISLSAKQHSPETGAIEFFACVDKGDVLTVLKGDTDSLIRRAYLGVAKAKRMARGKIAGGLVFYCSGARLLLEKKNLTAKMSPQLKQAFRDKPFILMFHNGEHGCIPGTESFHGNLMLDAVVFGE
jgi:hypothetical protein